MAITSTCPEAARAQTTAAFDACRHAQADELYLLALARSPSDASLLCDQSAALLKLGKRDEALQAARAAAALRPRWAKAHLSIGVALSAADRFPEACSALRRANLLQPGSPDIEDALSRVEVALSANCLHASLDGHVGKVHDLAFDKGMLATCGEDCTVRLWSCDTFTCLHELGTHGDQVTVVQWLDSGSVASTSLDCTAQIHSLNPDRDIGIAQLSGHQGRVTCLTRTSDGATLVTGCTDARVRVWDVPQGSCRHILSGHRSSVTSVVINVSDTTVASSSGDGRCRVWDLQTGECRHEIAWDCGGVNQCAFMPNSGLLATFHVDMQRREGRVLMWDVEGSEGWVDGRIQGYCRSIDNLPGKVSCALAVTEDGLVLLATACEDGSVRVYDAESCVSLYDIAAENKADTWAGGRHWFAASLQMTVAFCRKGTLLAVACGASHICLYMGLTGAHVLQLTTGQSAPVSAMAWHADSALLAAGYTDGSVKLWSIPNALMTTDAD